MTPPSRRLLVVADADSYVKWGITRALEAATAWDVEVVVVRSAVTPTREQIAAAADGRLARLPEVIAYRDLLNRLSRCAPDALLLACRGPLIELLMRDAFGRPGARPVTAAGLPGIWMPPTDLGLRLRCSIDLMVVHSEREREAVRSHAGPKPRTVALASLVADTTRDQAHAPANAEPAHRRLIFAPQALVPQAVADRRAIVEALADVAREHPELDVVIKVRGDKSDPQTHRDSDPYQEILAALGQGAPHNLTIGHGALSRWLPGAIGLVTVNSTAALEAVASRVPALCLEEFAEEAGRITTGFEASGLHGSFDDLRALRLRMPDPQWAPANYLHDPERDNWLEELDALVGAVRAEGSPGVQAPRGWRQRINAWRHRRQALGANDVWWARALGNGAAALVAYGLVNER
ncbi:DUF6716 putative glycosyltransferase [Demequina sp.]|uniref:DUF6716 putative glycosyltransferase n=1 Tax=Demequina sp. TaxID=2050685 RepID=UPI003A841432